MKIKCLKCDSTKDLVEHRILPIRHFITKKCIAVLCNKCHGKANYMTVNKEIYIYGRATNLGELEYIKLFEQFLAEDV